MRDHTSAVEQVQHLRNYYGLLAAYENPTAASRDGLKAVKVLTGLPTEPFLVPLGHLADDDRDEVTLRGLITGK